MNYMKAACADETEVITINHNDMAALEKYAKLKTLSYIFVKVFIARVASHAWMKYCGCKKNMVCIF